MAGYSSYMFARTFWAFKSKERSHVSPEVIEMKPKRLTKLTKPPLIIRTLHLPLLRMRIKTLIPRRTIPILRIPPTLRHPPQIILMQKLTRVALLAQPAEPVLAYCGKTFAVAGVRGELFGRLKVLGGGGGVA